MKNLFTEGLESRLLKYSIAAGAVLLAAGESDAQIVATNVDTTLSVDSASVSIVFGGNAKYHLRFVHLYSSTGPISAKGGVIVGNTSNAGPVVSTGKLPKALNSNYNVKSASVFAGQGSDTFVAMYFQATMFGASFVGSDKFIGLRFKTPADTGADSASWNYGWIKLHVYPGVDSIKVISYAYEETPDSSIATGQTSDISLAVQMEAFTAENTESGVELHWSTASEVNLSGFEVERSAVSSQSRQGGIPSGPSAQDWVKIGYVKSDGTSTSENDYSFADTNPVSGKVEYRLKEMNTDGTYKYTTPVTVEAVPTKFELSQNYPNPFNPTTKISYAIPKAEHVTLTVYNSIGEVVSTLVDEEKQPGDYAVTFNGAGLASGVYFYEISAGEFKQVKKLMLLK